MNNQEVFQIMMTCPYCGGTKFTRHEDGWKCVGCAGDYLYTESLGATAVALNDGGNFNAGN